jgi:hypothetical protein
MPLNNGGIFDLTGRSRNEPITVMLRPGVGIQHDNKHCEGGPHTFPPAFAMQLLHSNRATLYEGDDDIEIENGDPGAENGDPKPPRRRGR